MSVPSFVFGAAPSGIQSLRLRDLRLQMKNWDGWEGVQNRMEKVLTISHSTKKAAASFLELQVEFEKPSVQRRRLISFCSSPFCPIQTRHICFLSLSRKLGFPFPVEQGKVDKLLGKRSKSKFNCWPPFMDQTAKYWGDEGGRA